MLSREGSPVAVRINSNPMAHASFVQPAVSDLLSETGVDHAQIQAVVVANGPGSYTGLRVGLASAKGLCYAWEVPLITLSSLAIMAAAIRQPFFNQSETNLEGVLLAPMIDARRMEVFFAVYNNDNLQVISEPNSAVVDQHFLADLLKKNTIYFTGDGALKWKAICKSPHAVFIDLPNTEFVFAQEAFQAAKLQRYADIAYAEPFYTKAFYSTLKS